MSQLQLRSPVPGYALLVLALGGAALLFGSAIGQLYTVWNEQPEYSYGILIPGLSAFLIWRDRDKLCGLPLTGSWYGLLLVVVGLALRLIGQLATMPAVVHYALLMVLYGLILALTGPAIFRRMLMPLLLLIFMVPLPPVFTDLLSVRLQLISSEIGVWVIRAAGISVFLEGNVIDLGSYQLEVAQACSGLRYLFPLMTLSVIIAYTFGGAFWKRAIVFLASIPLTVLMNSVRIGIIGITVDRWGSGMAEGVLHEFEGWVGFMISAVVVVLIALGLRRVGRPKPGAATVAAPHAADRAYVAGSSGGTATMGGTPFQAAPRSFVAAAIVVLAGVTLEYTVPDRPEIVPSHPTFNDFPSRMGDWSGAHETMEQVYLDALRLDDYLLMNYSAAGNIPLNFYVAYYRSQRNGMSVHSPRLCLPGGGWKIVSFERQMIPATNGRTAWPVNRVLIEQGGQRQLVYYWFRERGRRLTNEYVVRWYIFWDALAKNRTDGSLVRVVAPVPTGTPESQIDRQLTRFATLSEEPLNRFLPD
jgi:exosortase D (VPLPA-CTERM-specific)